VNNSYFKRLNYVLEQRLTTHRKISSEEKEKLQKQLKNIFNLIENNFGLHPLPENKEDINVLCKFYKNNEYAGKGASIDQTEKVIMTCILLGRKDRRTLRINTYRSSMPKKPDVPPFEFELVEIDSIKKELFPYLSLKTGKQYDESLHQISRPITKTLKKGIFLKSDMKASDYIIPKKVNAEVTRYIRDTKLSKALKDKYEYRCQICDHRIHLPNGNFYAEAHHIQPIGNGHDGPDIKENLIVVCPNHHAVLDYGVIELHKNMLKYHRGNINQNFIDYHNQHIFNKKKEK
jgi:HNH endonuclease